MLNAHHIRLMLNSQEQAKRDGWYTIRRNAAKGEGEVFIYGVIGGSWFDEGVEALPLARELKNLDVDTLRIRVSSPGGSIDHAKAIRANLIAHPARNKETIVDGSAYSAASWVALADWPFNVTAHSRLMIHEPLAGVIGNPADFRREAEILDGFGDDIAAMLAERAGGSRQEWRDRMKEETWYSDQQAVDAGLADAIVGQLSGKGQNAFDASVLAIFKNTPAELVGAGNYTNDAPTKREAERALRDAGFSRSQAEALVSSGWNALPSRDAEEQAARELLDALRAATK